MRLRIPFAAALSCLAALVLPFLTGCSDSKGQFTPLPTQPLTLRYYGHGFAYVITTTGVRIALDPYGEETVRYPFPDRLPADIVLASCEREDHNASSRLFGAPQAFRSVTGIGLNNARGLMFRGTRTYLDKEQGARGGTNTVFGFTIDGIRIVHLGYIGHIPTASQREEIGTADVLFLPIGNKDLTPADLARIVGDLNARIIIPICFKTQYSSALDLRSLEEFLAGWKGPVKHVGAGEITLNATGLPKEPTIYVLDYPPKAQ
ncbi:L-ascorbate metabolism protein UlaG, beta-lactamase superfamily [Verrucomicrobium sp. GAS474]|uniref:MBL fold metallo-hydrolase n=1 Tax=Verrucomicrobium sp. GAS474 TaxID=1882831 RepID=UPI0008794584|nr:MBL fold metallo-hydrolase [Verrucomicrobium sp. GAS474]SDU29858.1 L-ascorbate metabolism protein UlaG, beta-lactamase superfamily [Verrucomicrobium sp. GAS474]